MSEEQQNFRIRELSSSNYLYDTDLLMISRKTSEGIYASYKVVVSDLLKVFDDKFLNLDSETIKGNWTIVNGGLFIDDSNIIDGKSAINLGYAYEKFMDKLNALSVEIYEKPHIPSCVGEIIFSTYLNTLEKVRKKYGEETDWIQLKGRFLLNAPSNIGRKAGAKDVPLVLNNIPRHIHNINFNTSPKKIKVNESISFKISTVAVANESARPKVPGNSKDGFPIVEDRSVVLDFAVEGNEKNSEGRPTSTCVKRLNGKMSINVNSGNNLGHNNIPPFYSVYMWKRTR